MVHDFVSRDGEFNIFSDINFNLQMVRPIAAKLGKAVSLQSKSKYKIFITCIYHYLYTKLDNQLLNLLLKIY